MPTVLAEFTSAPKGTEWKSKVGQWQTASVGDPLYNEYESRNTKSSDYGVELASEAQVDFPDGISNVTVDEYTGTAEYLNAAQRWITLPEQQTVEAQAVRTGNGSTVPIVVIAGSRGAYMPRIGG